MGFLLDTDICSAYLKNNRQVVGRVMLHFVVLPISVIAAGELLTWANRSNAPLTRRQGVQDFFNGISILEITLPIADVFGVIRAGLLDRGIQVGEMDLLIAAAALVHNLTVVTHNVQDYSCIPGLTIDDWQVP